ncbi:MAG: pyrroline-5-carboxylate reductase, partial [Magnetospirillum sp.]
PQVMAEVLPPYGRFAAAVFLSIAAGKPIAFFRSHLGDGAAIVRAMPNTPAAVRRGITVCCPGAGVDAPRRALCQSLLEAVGEVGWVEDESLMDAVTAVSGSGPAYVFLLAEVMAAAGIAQGLPPELAARLARATVSGAGELLRQSSDSAEQLRKNVTSPGGTTAAALAVLMADGGGLPGLMDAAVAAAARRGRELAG